MYSCIFKDKLIVFVCLLLLAFTPLLHAQDKRFYVLDMVHHNPGEPLTQSKFTDPDFLNKYGYNGQIFNDFVFAHAALTFDKLNPEIFPLGSKEREWVMDAAQHVRQNIAAAHKARFFKR